MAARYRVAAGDGVKLLTISLMMSCNRSCYYCPVKRWLVPLTGNMVNTITNATLLKWLTKYIDPREWIIEFTGGEPGLYPEIEALIPELAVRGYRGMIKTNGTLPIPKSGAFQLIAAWHEGEEFPVYYDQVLIIENPADDWRWKVRYCKKNGIPCQTVEFDRWFEEIKNDRSHCAINKMLAVLHINSGGHLGRCSKKPMGKWQNVHNMSRPDPLNELPLECPRCKNVADVEKFLPFDLRKQLEKDYEAHMEAKADETNRKLAELQTPEAQARAEIDPGYAAERNAKISALRSAVTAQSD